MQITQATKPVRRAARLQLEAAHTLGAVPTWWAQRAQLAGLPAALRDWRQALPEPPAELGNVPDGRILNASGFALGEAYACSLSHAERHQHGRHYTPRILAEALWREVERTGIELPAGPVVDPASGAGALLLRPLRQYVEACGRSDPGEALSRAGEGFTGVDTTRSPPGLATPSSPPSSCRCGRMFPSASERRCPG